MEDFIKGTLGKFLQLVFSLGGFVLLVLGLISCAAGSGVGGGIFILLGILCFCAVFGVRYWLGHIMRIR